MKKTEDREERMKRREERKWVRQEHGEVGQRGGLVCRNIIDTPSSPLVSTPTL